MQVALLGPQELHKALAFTLPCEAALQESLLSLQS